MQPITTSPAQLAAYRARLRSSHDYDVLIDVLDLDENPVGSATLLDGQIDLQGRGQPVRRTASLVLSNPDGALDAKAGATWLGTGLWLNRLVRIRHVLTVPGYGVITATVFIGPPTNLARQGPEVTVDCSDKAALAIRGCQPMTFSKGYNAVAAIKRIMTERTGEFRFRVPASPRNLSRDYSVGLADEAAPIVVARRIASAELGQELSYSCDGYLMLRPLPTQPCMDLGVALSQAQSTADFTTAVNTAYVYGGKVSKTVGKSTVTTQTSTILQLADSAPLSPATIQRRGVRRLLPVVETQDGYTTTTQTLARARTLITNGQITETQSINAVPVFDLDSDDVVTYTDGDGSSHALRIGEGSIPLLGDESGMSLGFKKKIGTPKLTKRPRSRRKTTVSR